MSTNSFSRAVADQMLAAETESQIAEQKAALAQNPGWAAGHYQLAQLYRVHGGGRDEAKRELLIALELEPSLADAHVALGEIYIAEGDFARAREHANYAAQFGNPRLLEQLMRYDQQSSLSTSAADGTDPQ
jgi:tetratricopeptide (TPR) repeat protein